MAWTRFIHVQLFQLLKVNFTKAGPTYSAWDMLIKF